MSPHEFQFRTFLLVEMDLEGIHGSDRPPCLAKYFHPPFSISIVRDLIAASVGACTPPAPLSRTSMVGGKGLPVESPAASFLDTAVDRPFTSVVLTFSPNLCIAATT